jgi:hypothetical protein
VAPDDASAEQKKEAMAHFTAGKAAAESKGWEKAESELRASLEVVNSPNARLVLARALRDSGKLDAAWSEYAETADGATHLAAADPRYQQTADAAKSEHAELEPKLAFVTVTVAHAPPDAALKVGGRTVPAAAWAAPIVVPQGALDVVLVGPDGKELARRTVPAAVGEKTPVDLDAQPAPPAAPAAPSADDVPPTDKPVEDKPAPSNGRRNLRVPAYAAAGVGGASLIVFGVFGAMEKSSYSNLQSACPGGVCPPSKSSEISSGKTEELVANVALGLGIVGVAAGATLFVLSLGGSSSSSSSQSASTSLVVSPTFIGLRGAL